MVSETRVSGQFFVSALVVVLTVVASVTAAVGIGSPAAAEPPPLASCAQPAGAQPTVMAPERLGVDKAGLDDAIAFAASRMRTHIQVFRNNCLIGAGPLNATTGDVPWNLFSSTKSVISMLAGIAYTQHRLDLNASIARYLPPGEADAAHARITVADLLTQTSGLSQSILSEAVTAGLDVDPNIAKQALALPVTYRPGPSSSTPSTVRIFSPTSCNEPSAKTFSNSLSEICSIRWGSMPTTITGHVTGPGTPTVTRFCSCHRPTMPGSDC